MEQPEREGKVTDVCEHLQPLLAYALERGAKADFAGKVWGRNCRMWVYVDRVLDLAALREKFALPACVSNHVHRGTHDGAEQGFACDEHHDAVMGRHPDASGGAKMLR